MDIFEKIDFKYRNIVAIIAENPESFTKECSKRVSSEKMNYLKKIPVISPQWNYEEVIEEMSYSLWENFEHLLD